MIDWTKTLAHRLVSPESVQEISEAISNGGDVNKAYLTLGICPLLLMLKRRARGFYRDCDSLEIARLLIDAGIDVDTPQEGLSWPICPREFAKRSDLAILALIEQRDLRGLIEDKEEPRKARKGGRL